MGAIILCVFTVWLELILSETLERNQTTDLTDCCYSVHDFSLSIDFMPLTVCGEKSFSRLLSRQYLISQSIQPQSPNRMAERRCRTKIAKREHKWPRPS